MFIAAGLPLPAGEVSGVRPLDIAPLRDVLRRRGLTVELLDGDEVRTELTRGLGYAREDRDSGPLGLRRGEHLSGLSPRI